MISRLSNVYATCHQLLVTIISLATCISPFMYESLTPGAGKQLG